MFDDRDREFLRDVLNASLTLMSILVVVVTFLAGEYNRSQNDSKIAEPIGDAIMGATGASFVAGVLALISLIQLRLKRGSTMPLFLAFGALIAFMTAGILFVVVHAVMA